MIPVEIRHFHLFAGLGGGAKGFNMANPRLGEYQAKFRCVGGVDVSPSAARNFERMVGIPGTVMDLFTHEQYIAYHGKQPPAGWREVLPVDIRAAAGNQAPHIVFTSSPCQGASGLQSNARAASAKYQALNELALRGIWLTLEAWADDPVSLILFENVPRIASRCRSLLDQITALFHQYGYAVAESTHDCGELGGLAESRKRFLMVARHMAKVPAYLYQPQIKPLASVGSLFSRMLLPNDPAAGPMHRVPRLQWQTWLRLALIPPGEDWRALRGKRVSAGGFLQDVLIERDCRNGYMGVVDWAGPSGTVAARNMPTNGAFSVADPRPGQTAFGKYKVTRWDSPAGTVIASSTTGQGAFAVADPCPGLSRNAGDNYYSGGHYGVIPWSDHCGAVSASASHDSGPYSVADPRYDEIPDLHQNGLYIIRTLLGDWHRPMTTKEFCVLQGLIEPEEHLELDGTNDQHKRTQIGNAVPPPSAQAIAEEMGRTLLLAWSGQTFMLNATPVWVRPAAMAISVATGGVIA